MRISLILWGVLSLHFLILPVLAETVGEAKPEPKPKNKSEKAQKWLLPPDVTMQDAQEMVGQVQGFYSMGGHWGSGWQEEEGRKAPTFRVYVTADFSPNQRALFQKVVDALKKPTYKPGKAEQDALDALNKKVNLHVKDAELPEIFNSLQNQVGIPIQMSPGLKDAIKEGKEAIPDYSVTLNLENISLKTCFVVLIDVFEDLTSPQCLEIADGMLIFCLPSEFREQAETDDIATDLTVRAYPIPKEILEAQKIQAHLPFQFPGMNNSSEILEVFIEAIRNIFPSKRNITLGCTQERILFVGTKLEHAEIAKFYAMWEGNDTVSETEKEFVKKLRKPVSLNYENMTVKEILTDMQKTFGFPLLIAGFSYLEYESDEDEDEDENEEVERFSYSCQNISVADAIREFYDHTLSCEMFMLEDAIFDPYSYNWEKFRNFRVFTIPQEADGKHMANVVGRKLYSDEWDDGNSDYSMSPESYCLFIPLTGRIIVYGEPDKLAIVEEFLTETFRNGVPKPFRNLRDPRIPEFDRDYEHTGIGEF